MEPKKFIVDFEAEFERERLIPREPCDSPIEDIFLDEFRKVANYEVSVGRQHECQTRSGAFRLDFILSHITNGAKLGIECDGRDFHSAASDSKRDAAIVAAGIVDKIYRLRGQDLTFRVHDALHLLAGLEPWLFSARGIAQLATLCRPLELREDSFSASAHFFTHAAMRTYEQTPDTGYDGWEDHREERPMFPTIIYWTQRNGHNA